MKKKILFLIHTLGIGGAEKVLVNLVNNMDKTKYDVTVMTIINTGAFITELNNEVKYKYMFNIPFSKRKKIKSDSKKESGSLLNKTSRIKEILKRIYQFVWRHISCKIIYKIFIKEKYDYEIAFLEGIPAKIIAESNNKDSIKISWIHVDLINEIKSEKFFKNRENEIEVYNKFDKIVAVSQYVKNQFIKKYKIIEEKVYVRYNPIDEKYIEKCSNQKINDIKKEKFTLCTIGRLAPQKGYDRLLSVVDKLNKDNIEFELWIIGVGPEEDKLKDYINQKNINNVKLLGYKINPYVYIKKADLFVCSSRAEGFSTVVSEAVILEKPIVTTDCSGMREILGQNSEYGLICDNNEEALYKALKDILSNKDKYLYYKNKVSERKYIFNIRESVKNIEKLLEG